jgi:hypothetical protein
MRWGRFLLEFKKRSGLAIVVPATAACNPTGVFHVDFGTEVSKTGAVNSRTMSDVL